MMVKEVEVCVDDFVVKPRARVQGEEGVLVQNSISCNEGAMAILAGTEAAGETRQRRRGSKVACHDSHVGGWQWEQGGGRWSVR